MISPISNFKIAIVNVQAPAKYRKWAHPVEIRVYDKSQNTGYGQKGKGANRITIWESGKVDSRYKGPKSAYGKSLQYAHQLVNFLNSQSKSLWIESAHGN